MKKIVIGLIIVMVISLGGCWSSREPKELAISSCLIYDIDENDIYHVTVEIINPSAIGTAQGKGSASGRSSITLKGTGKSIKEAFDDIASSIERGIYLEHNKIRFVTERFAKKDYAIKNLFEFIIRDTILDEKSLVFVIEDGVTEKLFEASIGLSNVLGEYVSLVAVNQPKTNSNGIFVSSLDFVRQSLSKYREPVAGVMTLVDRQGIPSLNDGAELDQVKYGLTIEGIALFKDDVYLGKMGKQVATVYNIISGDSKKASFTLPKDLDYAVIELIKPKSKIKTTIKGDEITININVSGDISITKLYDMSNDYYNQIRSIEQESKEMLEQFTMKTISDVQTEYGSDIFGFAAYIHSQHPKEWHAISSQWDDLYKKAKINVNYDVVVKRDGEAKKPYKGVNHEAA